MESGQRRVSGAGNRLMTQLHFLKDLSETNEKEKELSTKGQCAVERRLLLAGANPAQQLSLRLVAARAGHGGNDMD